ncbi:MAG TPA: hypothetical protein VGH27_01565 [Streptosporangiaceae bacterium]
MPGSHSPDSQHGWPPPGDLDALHAFTIRHVRQMLELSSLNDKYEEMLAARVSAIEEVYAARWPRRWLLAARLRRALRASTRHLGYVGTFTQRRAETASLEVHPGGGAVARKDPR